MTIKTPEQVLDSVLESPGFRNLPFDMSPSDWHRVALAAIEADRAQRPEIATWAVIDEDNPGDPSRWDTYVCTEETAKAIAELQNDLSGTVSDAYGEPVFTYIIKKIEEN